MFGDRFSSSTSCSRFFDDCQRWEGILRGVLANMKLSAGLGGDARSAHRRSADTQHDSRRGFVPLWDGPCLPGAVRHAHDPFLGPLLNAANALLRHNRINLRFAGRADLRRLGCAKVARRSHHGRAWAFVDRRGRSSDRRTSDVLHRPHRRGSDPDLFRKSESAHLLRAGSPGGGQPGPSPAAADPVSPARGAAGASWFAAHGLRSPPSLSPRLQQLHFNSRQACPNHTEPLGGGEAQIKHTVADERSAVVNANHDRTPAAGIDYPQHRSKG